MRLQTTLAIVVWLGLKRFAGVLAFHASMHRLDCIHRCPWSVTAVQDDSQEYDTNAPKNRRRELLAMTGATVFTQLPSKPVVAVEDDRGDLTSQMFNPDGSLKGDVEEAKTRTVNIAWGETADKYNINIDGTNSAGTESGSQVKLYYKIPDKWQQKQEGYFDKSTTDLAKACERIYVYRAPGKVTPERLSNAATIGISDALYVTDELKELKGADLLSGRTRKQGEIKFYDFDMALAPKTCGDSKENLGLGFCPFDSITLLSAAVLDDALYVLAVQCDKDEWKIANSDLKRVRSSFAFDV